MNNLLDINTAVIAKIKTSSSTVANLVIDRIATKEIERRADALAGALQEANNLQKEINKVKPDVKTFDKDGNVQTEGYSLAKTEERKKLQTKLDKIESAVTNALRDENPDFSQLLSLKGGDEKKNEPSNA